jgi:hypothetical protein
MDSLDSGAAAQDDLGLRSVDSLEDLGDSLRRLRRRYARRQRDALLSYRYLAEKTGYAHGVIGGYFSGKVLPPPDKLDVLIELLGVSPPERRDFARVRDAIEERRRRPTMVQPPAGKDQPQPGAPGGGRPAPETVAASGFLYELLTRSGKYRAMWRAKLVSGAGAHAAIADVIAEHLAARVPNEPPQEPERLQRRVVRALARGGPETALSSTVLEWFIGAFVIDREDADRLRFLYTGSSSIRYVRGDAEETKLPIFDAPEARHRTIDLREYHYLGPDGLPAMHRTDQIVEAMVDGLDRIPYLADTGWLTVDVQNGGIPSPLYQIRAADGNVYHALDILLDRTLLRGDTAVLNYTTTFSYAEPPETLVRRGFRRKVDSFLLWVRFHPEMVPTSLWWAEWDGVTGGQITRREPVALSPEFEAHRFLQGGAAQAVVGFCWEW